MSKTQGKTKLFIITLFIMLSLSIGIYARVVSESLSPIDPFHAIKGGNADSANITFIANGTVSTTTAAIQNATLWHNISGVWSANYTNTTIGAINTVVNRIFPPNDTHIIGSFLPDNLIFNWAVEFCDNKTSFEDESVTLDTNGFGIVFDNHTNSTGDGLCTGTCNNSVIILGGRGFLLNLPTSISGDLKAANSSTGFGITGLCAIVSNETGEFYCNQTKTERNNITGSVKTTISTLIDSTVLMNYTTKDSCSFSANRTVFVNNAPNVTINNPLDNQVLNSSTILINVTVTGDAAQYGCFVFTNDSGTFEAESGSFNAINNTPKISSVVITSPDVILNVKCHETTNGNVLGWDDNITISSDSDNPSITILQPEDNFFSKGITSASVVISLNVTDNNADKCVLKVNGTDNNTISYTTGTQFFHNFNATDGVYGWNVVCNDTANSKTVTANRTVTVDTVFPSLNRNINYSNLGTCKGFTVELNASEEVNLTFKYGTSSMSQTHTVIESDFAINQTVILTFNESYETDFFANATICDRAGNCNTSVSEMTIPSPVSLCNGWNLWSIYDSQINMSDLLTDTQSEFVYWWNNTPQNWLFVSGVSTSSNSVNLGIGNMVHVFTSTNVTWFRNNSGVPVYELNITSGHNYLPLYYGTTIGNLSHIQFRNQSGGNLTNKVNKYGDGNLSFEINFYDVYNNTAQGWTSNIFRWSRNNLTEVGGVKKIGLDTLHISSTENITVNMSRNGGHVFANWSVG